MNAKPVSIVMVEDDEGHARLIERNIRRAGVNNEIVAFKDGTSALAYLFGADGSGEESSARKWLDSDNRALNGRPIELISNTEGLVRVVHYLDASRGLV